MNGLCMMKLSHSRSGSTLVLLVACAAAGAQTPATPLTLQQVLDIARAKNPSLLSVEQHVDATKAAEITAGLRQNPNFTISGADISLPASNPAAHTPMRPTSRASSSADRNAAGGWTSPTPPPT